MRWVWTVVVGVVAGLIGTLLALGLGHPMKASYSAYNPQVPLLGASVADMSALSAKTAQFGHMPVIRVYYPGLPGANAWTSGLPAANKSAVVVSFKALPSAILSGRDDAVLRHFFDMAPRGHPIWYTYFHEPEDNIAAGQFTAAAYRAAWAHVAAIAAQAHNPYLRSTLILMAWDLKRASHRNWRNYLPGGHIISTLGWDAYTGGGGPSVSPSRFMGPAIAASKQAGLPYGFAEFGLPSVGGRPGWLTQVGNYLMRSGAVFGTLFDTAAVHPSFLMTDSSSISVWRRFVQASARANGIGSFLPGGFPGSSGPQILGLALSQPTLTPDGGRFVTIRFRLTERADVTVLVLNGSSTVTRLLADPRQGTGAVSVRYSGDNSHGRAEPAGQYQILVVASNSLGSATAEAPLTITG